MDHPTWHGIELDAETALALLEWQAEMGVDEPVGDAPVDRFDLAAAPPPPSTTSATGMAMNSSGSFFFLGAPSPPSPSVTAGRLASAEAASFFFLPSFNMAALAPQDVAATLSPFG